jgi:hypothetical protein
VTRDKTFVVETYGFIQAQTRQQSSPVYARLLTIKNNLRDHFVVVFDRFVAFLKKPIAMRVRTDRSARCHFFMRCCS